MACDLYCVWAVACRYFANGWCWVDGLSPFTAFRAFPPSLCVLFEVLPVYCLITERPAGGFLRGKCGSKSLLLESDSATALANSSTVSFPVELIWPAAQEAETSILVGSLSCDVSFSRFPGCLAW